MTRLRSAIVRLLPGSPHGRMRLLFLVLAVASAAATLPPMLLSDRPPAVRIAAALVACALSAYWIHGFRRRSFSLAGEPLEAAAVFVLLATTPGDPFLPLFGIIFRGLYGGVPLAVARSALWITALLAAHAPRGADAVHADIARSMGLALAPLLVPPLRSALERLAASERRLRSLVQNSTDVVTVVAKDLRVRYQADSIRPVLGHDADAIVGTPLLDLVHPDDREELAEFFRQARGEPDCVRQLLLRLRHGRGVWRDFEVVAANRLHDPSIEGFVLNMRDITERLQIERLGERLEAQRVRQDLERRLQRAQRLESVGQLAGGVAHDFNNLLAAILNTASLVRDELEPASPLQDDLSEIEDVARRGARLVRQLLLFSQRKPTTPEVLDLNAVIGDLDRLMRRSLGSQVRLGFDLDPQLAPVEADLSNVEQVLVNLLVNARDALGDGGTVTVETANVEVVPEAAVDLEVEPGWYVRLSVVDDGAGMDAATLERAVEPFFTTKDPGTGTGLGLATVLGVADQAGGTVWLESEPGEGTSVLVYLPAATPAG